MLDRPSLRVSPFVLQGARLLLVAAAVVVGVLVYGVVGDGTFALADLLSTDGDAFHGAFGSAAAWVFIGLGPLYGVALAVLRFELAEERRLRCALSAAGACVPLLASVFSYRAFREAGEALEGNALGERLQTLSFATPALFIAGTTVAVFLGIWAQGISLAAGRWTMLALLLASCVGPILLRLRAFTLLLRALPRPDPDDARATASQPVAG